LALWREGVCLFLGGGGLLYPARARAQPAAARVHPAGAVRPALMGRAAHSVGAKESRRPPTPLCLGSRQGCGTRLAHRASPPRRPTPVVHSEGGGGAHPPGPFGLSPPPGTAAAGAALPSLLRYHAVGGEVPLGRFVRTLLRPSSPGAAQIRARLCSYS
jgi:hypothetical protein